MARHYAPKAVLRQLPLHLIRSFLAQSNITVGGDWDSLVEGDANALYRAWCDLPQGHREAVEQMLRQVHEMASDAAVRGMISEACFRGRDIADDLSAVEGHHAKALWVLIHQTPAFHTARQLLAAAFPNGRFWNLTAGFGGAPYDASPAALQALRLAVTALYREQGRGHRCTAEPYERCGCYYVFLYLDDYTHTHTAHNPHGTLTRTPLRSAFEVVYVYARGAGTLDMYAHGDSRWRASLRDLFCEHVLHTATPPGTPGRRAYRLNGLIDRWFPLAADPARGVNGATVRRLRLTTIDDKTKFVTLETRANSAASVYDMLDVHFPLPQFPRHTLLVNQVTFTVRHVPPGADRERTLTFDVSFPDACNLKSLPHDQREVGEWCLRRWGILNDASDAGDSDDDTGDADPGDADPGGGTDDAGRAA